MKKRIPAVLFVISLFIQASFGQTTEAEVKLRNATSDTLDGGKFGGTAGINFTQASFSNWAAGGENSIALNGILSIFANYKKGSKAYDNMLDVGYGFLSQGKTGKVIKTDDKIDLTSKYGSAVSKSWYYAVLFNFRTQMAPGYNYPNDSVKISDLLAPAYLLGAIGMDYKPSDHFTAFIAPLTLKTTIVNDRALADAGAFGVKPATYSSSGLLLTRGEMTRQEFGGYFRMVYRTTFFSDKSVSLLTKLDLFSNYMYHTDNIDVSWETIIALKVNKYISSTITTHLVYDEDVIINVDRNNDGVIEASGPRTQFKEVIAVGLTLKF